METGLFYLELSDGSTDQTEIGFETPLTDDFLFNDNLFDFSSFEVAPSSEVIDQFSPLVELDGAHNRCAPEDSASVQNSIQFNAYTFPALENIHSDAGPYSSMTEAGPFIKPTRTRISAHAKAELRSRFALNAYPNEEARNKLAISLDLPERTVRTWFANARARTDVPPILPSVKSHETVKTQTESSNSAATKTSRIPFTGTLPIDIPQPSRSYSVASSVSSMASVAHSICSVRSTDARGPRQGRRGWSLSQTPDHGSYLMDSSFRDTFLDLDSGKDGDDTQRQQVGNGVIFSSDSEHLSDLNSPMNAPVNASYSIEGQRYYCTETSCYMNFRYRYEWERHEEAIHYRPYRWICCHDFEQLEELNKECSCTKLNPSFRHDWLKDFARCAKKPEGRRTFYRRDQLRPHVGRHIRNATQKKCIDHYVLDLLDAWKSDNPDMKQEALHCGFCGAYLTTWTKRLDHVFEHLKSGMCRDAWWPDRLPIHNLDDVSSTEFMCPNCKSYSGHFDDAITEHPICTTWSCRYLHDYHSTFAFETNDTGTIAQCRLCSFVAHVYTCELEIPAFERRMWQHTESKHKLRSCKQEIFTSMTGFMIHLQNEHGAKAFEDFNSNPWKHVQGIVRHEGRALLCTAQRPPETPVCYTNFAERSFLVID